MQFSFVEIVGLVGGTSGLTAFLQWLITAKIQRKKEQALAGQEVARVDQEKAAALDKTGDIYAKLTAHVDEALGDMRSEMKTVKEENKEMKAENKEMLTELNKVKEENMQLKKQVSQLSRDLDDYKKKCKNCIS
ncbi:MAG: hypothetical protein ACOVNR_00170 [Chitinophagaceae bacterium]